MPRCLNPLTALMVLATATGSLGAEEVTREVAVRSLTKAVQFYHEQVATHGGYVWRYSGDLELREGEAQTGLSTIWVQPPGTPTVGEAFLDAFEATQDPRALQAARETAAALVQGQLQSGGWNYFVEFDPQKRKEHAYRVDRPSTQPTSKPTAGPSPSGWDEWKKRKHKGNMTVADDDTTQAALRFLMRLDQQLEFKDAAIHEAAQYALASLLQAQYPNGAWSHCYDSFPAQPPAVDQYPIQKASYPSEWSRTWTKDWTGCYRLNDRITLDLIAAMLEAHETYGDERYLTAAKRGGDFLLLAQMPDPQPAWAQQYNRDMQPVWDRKFEPPAITGLESQDTLETLLRLFRRTGEKKYLSPIAKALAYLRTCELPDGKLARFYELKTNKPLYFTRDYQLTYAGDAVPKHYGFTFNSRLDKIEAEYLLLRHGKGTAAVAKSPSRSSLAKRVRPIIDRQDYRGAWVEQAGLDAHEVKPKSGVIESRTFADNVRTLSQFIRAQD